MKRKFSLALGGIVLAVVIIALVVLTTLLITAPKDDFVPDDNSDIKLVVLGDSIAEAVLGPSPISEREDYSYCSLLGQINGFTYHNRAVSGYETKHLLEYISREKDDSAYAHITKIKEADVIVISILGNDFLLNGFNENIISAMNDDYTRADAILANSYVNIDGIVKRIRTLNPDVELIIQTVYNPMFPESLIMEPWALETLLNDYDVKKEDLHHIASKLINRLNNVLFEYLKNNPDSFRIADVNAKFDAIYKARPERLDRFIYEDYIHPSNEGHAIIMSTVQSVLEDLGLCDPYNALVNYKNVKIAQLHRLYDDTEVKVSEVESKIKSAYTIDEVTEVYFDGVYGVDPIY